MSVLTRCHAQNGFSCHVSTSSVALEQLRRLIHQDFLHIYFSFSFLLQTRICSPLGARRFAHARKMNARNVGVTSSLKAASSPGSRCLSAFYHFYSVPAYYVQDGRNLCFTEMLGSSRASHLCVLEICWERHDTSWLQRGFPSYETMPYCRWVQWNLKEAVKHLWSLAHDCIEELRVERLSQLKTDGHQHSKLFFKRFFRNVIFW